jgi:rod shape-determining protein MreC
MRQFFAFLSAQKVLLLFLFLESFSLTCLFLFNTYQKRIFSSWLTAQMEKVNFLIASIKLYYYLDRFNQNLMEENIALRKEVIALHDRLRYYQTRVPYLHPLTYQKDSLAPEYRFHKAKVIKTELLGAFNYCVINKGKKHGLQSGNGVVLPTGALGIITEVNDHQSLVYLFSNPKLAFTFQIGMQPIYCRYQWNPNDPYSGFLYFIPAHEKVRTGDKVYTTGIDQIFPPLTYVGKIIGIQPDPNHPGYQIAQIQLHYINQPFSYVYVVQPVHPSIEADSTFTRFQKHLNLYSKHE